MDKVSVIVPNYNGAKYIYSCIKSVMEQEYKDIEIIIIDDGSTDKSIETINQIIDENKNIDIKLIAQNNMNAAIARNEGMKVATGRYVLFLDSDDILEKDMLNAAVEEMKKNSTDLLVGNYIYIDEEGKKIEDKKFFNENSIISGKEIFEKIVDISPVPSNKLYNMEVIKKYNLTWGNVRIGQDLNFYLKYLLCCKKISVINKSLYRYRIVNTSVSRTYDFRIFDIVNSFEDVKKFYKKNQKYDLYESYIQVVELKNYNLQVYKQKDFEYKRVRKLIVNYFNINEKKLNYEKCLNYTKYYKKIRLKFKFKYILRFLYTSNIYKKVKGNK